MSRVKVSEFTAKKTLYPSLSLSFAGIAFTAENFSQVISNLPPELKSTNLVLKVDQGIKKRGKLGLVKVNITSAEIPVILKSWIKLGWTNFLLEPVIEHSSGAEHYLALTRARQGWEISYSPQGGVEVESSWDSVTTALPGDLRNTIHQVLIPALDSNHIAFLEMNPVLLRGHQLIPLDMACEVDSAASTLPTLPDRALTSSERSVATLDASTPASLKFKLINPGGRIWMFLSGGGASLVLADEVADLGMGAELANYGEYSGAPSNDDVYSYAKIILQQLLSPYALQHVPKVIIIAGGVANFTDVASTFHGLIRALEEQKSALKKAHVKVFVRRGGPNETKGLEMMHTFLGQSGLLGSVHGHDTPLTQVVSEVHNYLVGVDHCVDPK